MSRSVYLRKFTISQGGTWKVHYESHMSVDVSFSYLLHSIVLPTPLFVLIREEIAVFESGRVLCFFIFLQVLLCSLLTFTSYSLSSDLIECGVTSQRMQLILFLH